MLFHHSEPWSLTLDLREAFRMRKAKWCEVRPCVFCRVPTRTNSVAVCQQKQPLGSGLPCCWRARASLLGGFGLRLRLSGVRAQKPNPKQGVRAQKPNQAANNPPQTSPKCLVLLLSNMCFEVGCKTPTVLRGPAPRQMP